MQSYNENRFREQVDASLKTIKQILNVTRHPVLAEEVQHQYVDKYGLSEYLGNTSIAAVLNALELLGLSSDKIALMKSWSKSRAVTCRFQSEEHCTFNRETTRTIESKQSTTQQVPAIGGITNRLVNTVTEYFWNFSVSWSTLAFINNGEGGENSVVLQQRTGHYEILTITPSTPRPILKMIPKIDVDITWLLNYLTQDLQCQFKIDRSQASCRTPRHNLQTEELLGWFAELYRWCTSIQLYLSNKLFPVQIESLDVSSIDDFVVFNPIQPLFEGSTQSVESPLVQVVQVSDANLFLSEQKRSIREVLSGFAKLFPSSNQEYKLISYMECVILIITSHCQSLCQYYQDGVDYIEDMLRKQLVAAIGKELQPADFTNYMKFHNLKLYKREYALEPFCYAIRRPLHYPEGVISIELDSSDGCGGDPISTGVKQMHSDHTSGAVMHFDINAATRVSFGGARYLHSWLNHSFEGGTSEQKLTFNARAKQFSSFIVLLGRITSPTLFDPKYAIVLQNKDDLNIPLELEQIPTAKEFTDAIDSLSSEQQRFCKAYRQMQLESTLFGIVIIQLKPQLEKLLNLPNDSLTKEIELTENLLELFIKYQIPSDQLSYDLNANPAADPIQKIEIVKRLVGNIYSMINAQKQNELNEKKRLEQAEECAKTRRILLECTESLLVEQSAPMELECHSLKFSKKAKNGSGLFSKVKKAFTRTSKSGYSDSNCSVNSVSRNRRTTRQIKTQNSNDNVEEMESLQLFCNSVNNSAAYTERCSIYTRLDPSENKNTTNFCSTGSTIDDNNPRTQSRIEPEEIKQISVAFDYTTIPKLLDSKFEELHEDSSLRANIINVGDSWTKKSQKQLLADPITEILYKEQQTSERNKAFDLLDALSRSGSLLIDQAELHVIIGSTYLFDKSLMDTIIQDNVNPIEKLERSSLIIAATIQNKPTIELIQPNSIQYMTPFSAPALM